MSALFLFWVLPFYNKRMLGLSLSLLGVLRPEYLTPCSFSFFLTLFSHNVFLAQLKLMGNVLVLLRKRKNRRFGEIWCKKTLWLSHGVHRASVTSSRAPVILLGPRPVKGGVYSCLSSILPPPFSNPYCSPENITFIFLQQQKILQTHFLYLWLFLAWIGTAWTTRPWAQNSSYTESYAALLQIEQGWKKKLA